MGDMAMYRRNHVIGTYGSIETMLLYAYKGDPMRTTIALDDELVRQAENYTGIKEKAALVREALTRLVRNEAARRLAALGGSDPKAAAAPRRRGKK
jgi:Arc/MetJ family transcription regulator